ncbi:MAG: hypothetical protein U1F76_19850 [Candidatus Competibacteraceae bacterium]
MADRAQKAPTTAEVIAMFREALDLPVTDDGQTIADRAKATEPRYARMKGSPDAQQRNKADLWYQRIARLQNDRPALLEIVYEHFTQLADAALEAALSSGVTALTPVLYQQLQGFAEKECQCDPPLAQSFADTYLRNKALTIGEPLVVPHLVASLKAGVTAGQVELRWQLPPAECDEVIVRRYEALSTGQFQTDGRELCRGKLNTYLDHQVTAGQRYRYAVYSVWRGVISTQGVTVEALAIAEVADVKAGWSGEHVRLQWRLPSPTCAVLIFRAPSPIQPLPPGMANPLPGADAKPVFRGSATEWVDPETVAGEKYHYLLVASFAPGSFSSGVSVAIRTPIPPPAVSTVKAEYREGAVSLHWPGVRSAQAVDYVVVRRTGNIPAGSVKDGEILAHTPETQYRDQAITAGRRYIYTVFTRTEGVYSRRGTAASPVYILAEVTDLGAQTGDGTVELHWHTPANISRVLVCRDMTPPAGPQQGERVALTGQDHAKDEGIENGQIYHYLVCCGYKPDGVNEVFSLGARLEVTPQHLPEPVQDFSVQVQGREVLCTWSPPAFGQVVVIRSATPLNLHQGQRLGLDALDRLGERIATETGHALDVRPDQNQPYYSVFTVGGTQAIAGGSTSIVVCPDVTALQLAATRDGVILRWVWPDGYNTVVVARRLDDWPQSPADPQAICMPCTRIEYRDAGEKFVDTLQQKRGKYHYVVYTQVALAAGQFFAPGTEPGCRAVIQWEPWMTLRYRLSSPRRGRYKGKALQLFWSVETPFPNFAGFVLTASAAGPPSSTEDGVELFRWTPSDGPVENVQQTAWISLEPVRQRRWARFFCKAGVLDPAQRYTIQIVHPDTCIPFSEQGERQTAIQAPAPRHYQPGIPRKVICPYCFEEFPLEQMLFSSYGGGVEPRPARYTWLDRLLHRPLRTPKDPQGRLLTQKQCPSRHVLPYTAGTQASLVIGVIGAKFSGKSHYIAALIERLGSQVAFDWQADLLPVTEETSTRYQREFYEPLFGKRLELPATTGTPSPLIYDLYFSGKLEGKQRNRSVTLALYDTAGENFDNPDVVRQMVRYLRVASGLLLLIDPLQSPIVREALPSSIPLPDLDQMAEPNVIISRILTELEGNKIVTQAGPLATPVAVVLTKCDVLRDSGLIDSNRLWSSDYRHVGYFDRESHEDMTGMMGECVLRWSPRAYNTVQARFPRHGFFGVSPTGCASDKTTRRYQYVSPWRVEDPLLWLLAELGVIPTR